jgi:hypothetical protein
MDQRADELLGGVSKRQEHRVLQEDRMLRGVR